MNITDPVPNGALAFKSFLFTSNITHPAAPHMNYMRKEQVYISWISLQMRFHMMVLGLFFFAFLNYSCHRIFNIEFMWSTVARVIHSLFYLSYKTFPLVNSNSIVLPLSWLSISWAVQFPEFSSLLVTCCSLLSACRELEIWSPCSLLTCCRCSRSNLSLSDDLSRSCLLKDIC